MYDCAHDFVTGPASSLLTGGSYNSDTSKYESNVEDNDFTFTIAASTQNQEALCGSYRYTVEEDPALGAFSVNGNILTVSPSKGSIQ